MPLHTVQITDMVYTPSPARVRIGDTIEWHNNDPVDHTATEVGGGFNTGTIPPGATSVPLMAEVPGFFTYTDLFHLETRGQLEVGP
jgi:plastocyanin